MEISEFITETNRIENFYEKELTEMQRKEWYRELKNMPINRYRQIVTQSLRECKFMPKLADIVSINNNLPYNSSSQQDLVKEKCDKCNGDGVIKYNKEILDGDRIFIYEFFAKCNCKNAKQFNYDGTNISDTRHRSKFYIPSLQELNLDDKGGESKNGN